MPAHAMKVEIVAARDLRVLLATGFVALIGVQGAGLVLTRAPC